MLGKRTTSFGFTLIELLVTVGIAVTMMGVGAAVFTGFRQRQMVQTTARELQVFLRSAQNYARVGTIPSDCQRPLDYYEVSFNSSGVGTVRAKCNIGGVQTLSSVTSTFQKAGGFSITANGASVFTMRFLPLYGGVELGINGATPAPIGATPASISISRSGQNAHAITLDKSGNLSDPGVVIR